jgi:hypothetical protein
VSPRVRVGAGDDDLVALGGPDLVVAARAAVGLLRLIRLHMTNVDVVVVVGPAVRAHEQVTVSPRRERSVRLAPAQLAGCVDLARDRAAITRVRSGSRTRRNQAPCHSHAASQAGQVKMTDPPENISASIVV